MVQTGIITIPYWIAIVALLLPLIPVFIIFFRRIITQESLNHLMILCLFLFIEQLVLQIPQFASIDPKLANPAFRLGEFVILLWLFRSALQQKWLRELLSYFLVGFMCIVITIFLNRGLTAYSRNIDMVEDLVLVILSILVLLQLIRNQYMFVFQSPLFWIAGGTLCFYMMAFLIEVMAGNGLFTGEERETEKLILISGFSIVRSIFYIIAASIKQFKKDNNGWMFLPREDNHD
jgi:hypothetical protein